MIWSHCFFRDHDQVLREDMHLERNSKRPRMVLMKSRQIFHSYNNGPIVYFRLVKYPEFNEVVMK